MATADFDRLAALKEFDETKAGVKGLVDSGITSIPLIFHHSNTTTPLLPARSNPRVSIPTVDLSLPRPAAVDLIRSAASTLGFFHVTNHGVPLDAISRAISAVRSFNELPLPARSAHYSREYASGVNYASNFDLYLSPAATWRDTIQIRWTPVAPDPQLIPEICRDELVEIHERFTEAGKLIMGMMAEGLGVEPERLEELTCHEGRQMVCHYYPWCPEPDRTFGIAEHKDPGVITLLAQGHVGGLQVKWEGQDGEFAWVDVEPVDGALVINVGDLLQIISNNQYKSVEHRVIANSNKEARVSIGIFFNPGKRSDSDLYGPLPELVSSEKPAAYRNITMTEFIGGFFGKDLGSNLLDQFKL